MSHKPFSIGGSGSGSGSGSSASVDGGDGDGDSVVSRGSTISHSSAQSLVSASVLSEVSSFTGSSGQSSIHTDHNANQQRLMDWLHQQPDALPPQDAKAPLDDETVRLCRDLGDKLKFDAPGDLPAHRLVKLGGSSQPLSRVARRVPNGGLNARDGTIIISVGQPRAFHVFRKYEGQWHRHGLTDHTLKEPQPVSPEDYIRHLLKQPECDNAKVEFYQLCTQGQRPSDDDLVPWKPAYWERWFKHA